jgi:ATP-dependent Clp protease ATP-binding subunit ClpA
VKPRLSPAAEATLTHAALEASALGDDRVGPEHVLLVLAEERDTVAGRALAMLGVEPDDVRAALDGRAALAALGIDLDEVRRRVEEAFGPGALANRNGAPPRPRARRLCARARREARAAGCRQVAPEHLLLAIAAGNGAAAAFLRSRGASADELRRALIRQPSQRTRSNCRTRRGRSPRT